MFAVGTFHTINNSSSYKDKWTELKNKLNAMGGAIKTEDQWKKVSLAILFDLKHENLKFVYFQTWMDLKLSIRKKCSEHKKYSNKTGGGSSLDPGAPRDLNNLEKRIFAILTPHSTDGDGETPELLGASATSANRPMTEIVNIADNLEEDLFSSSPKAKKKDNK